jgi:hypothetical protein
MSLEVTRHTSHGRPLPTNYYATMEGMGEEEILRIRGENLQAAARAEGFGSVFDAALALARSSRDCARSILESGGLGDLYRICEKSLVRVYRRKQQTDDNAGITDVEANDQPHGTDPTLGQAASRHPSYLETLCEPAERVYVKEWKRLTENQAFRTPLDRFTSDSVSAFSISAIYSDMKNDAPCLFRMLENLPGIRPDTTSNGDGTLATRKMQRHLVTAVSILGNQTSNRFNILQTVVGYTLFAYKAPKRAVAHLHHLGMSVSYSSIIAAVKSCANSIRAGLRQICAPGHAIMVSFDNLTYAAPVATQTILNQSSYVTATAGYVLQPPLSRRQPMFTHDDIKLEKALDLSVRDIIPSPEDRECMRKSIRHMLWEVVKRFASDKGIEIADLECPMPDLIPLDPKERSTITTLPTYPLNEGEISDMIDIHYNIRDDIGLSPEQVQHNVLNYKGDLMTVQNDRFALHCECYADEYRRAVFRQSCCSPEEQLGFVEATAGLFHTEIHALNMMFETHLGTDTDVDSLSRWISALGRDRQTLWDSQKSNVKNFRASKSFWNIVLDAHLLAALADKFGWNGMLEMENRIGSVSAEALGSTIDTLAAELGRFSAVSGMRNSPAADRDVVYENQFLFMQHGLVLRSFDLAIRQGDTGRVVTSLSFFAVWFQMTKKHQYAMEIVHLVACIRGGIWSPSMVEFWMRNCVINLSGKREGFIACDHLGEIVVREVKSMMHHSVNEATGTFLRNYVSPSIMLFYQLKRKMTAETDAPTYGYRSSRVNTMTDIRAVADTLLDEKISSTRNDREVADAEVVDLHVNGLVAMGTTVILRKYIEKLARDRMFGAEDVYVGDTLEVEEETVDGGGDEDAEDEWMEGEEIADMVEEEESLSDAE